MRYWEFGAAFKKARNRAGMSQIDVARKAGMNAGHIMNIELGRTNPGLMAVANMCGAVGVRVSEIIKTIED